MFDWIPIHDYTFRVVLVGTVSLGMLSGLMGSFLTMRRESLLGDGIAHSSYPGILLAFMVMGTKRLDGLLMGAFLTAMIAVGLIAVVRRRTTLTFDGTLATVLSSFFGLGLVLASYVGKSGNAHQAGLNRFIFGQASAISADDVRLTLILAAVASVLMLLFWKEQTLLAFDKDYAAASGFSVAFGDALLVACATVTVLLSIQAVGIILMSAMLIAPPVAARQWTKHFGTMTCLSIVFGGCAAAVGTAVSSATAHMPAGPAIVVAASGIAFVSLAFSRRKYAGGAV